MHYRITAIPSKHAHQSSKSSKRKNVTYDKEICTSRRKRCNCDQCRHRDSHRYHGDHNHRRHYEHQHRHSTRNKRYKYPDDDYISPNDLISSHLKDIEKKHYRKGPSRRNEWSTMSLFNTRSFRHPSYSNIYPSHRSYHPHQPSMPRYPYGPPYSRSRDLRDNYDEEASDEYSGRIIDHFLHQKPRGYEAYPEYESYSSGWDTDVGPTKSEYDRCYYGNPWPEGMTHMPLVPNKMTDAKGRDYGWNSSPY